MEKGSEKMRISILILGLVLMIGISVIVINGVSSESIISPCVDGDGDINLAGIMCDKEIFYMYGLDQNSFDGGTLNLIFILSFILGSFIFIIGIFSPKKGER